MSETHQATLTIENELGMHARAATVFVQLASQFTSEVYVTKDDREVNGKSIMGVLTLVASRGTRITIRTEGEDAAQALEALSRLVQNKFGEDR